MYVGSFPSLTAFSGDVVFFLPPSLVPLPEACFSLSFPTNSPGTCIHFYFISFILSSCSPHRNTPICPGLEVTLSSSSSHCSISPSFQSSFLQISSSICCLHCLFFHSFLKLLTRKSLLWFPRHLFLLPSSFLDNTIFRILSVVGSFSSTIL